MTVSNNQLANETTFNSSFMSREIDTDTLGKVDLLNTAPESGATLTNIQANINAISSATGIPTNQIYNYLLTWASDIVGAPNDTLKARIEAITALFAGLTGHAHAGVDGDGKKISAADLVNINYYTSAWQMQTMTGFSGLSVNVSSYFTLEVPNGGASTIGIITSPPYNDVALYLSDGTQIEDAEGRKVFGRLTEALGVWTISFYVKIAGVETAYSIPTSTNFDVFYRKVFTLADAPTIESSPALGSVQISADVPDATPTVRGLVSLASQSFAGQKTFQGGLVNQARLQMDVFTDSTTVGPTASFTAPQKMVLRYTQPGITSISAISGGAPYQFLVLTNASATKASLPHNGGVNGFFHNGGQALDLFAGASVSLMYEPNSQRWHSIGGGGASGTQLQEVPSGTVNGINNTFTLSFTPISSEAVSVYLDGVLREETKWTLIGNNIIFNAGEIPASGQKVYVVYSTGSSGGGGGGGTVQAETQYFTLSAGDITAKKVTLAAAPVGANKTLLDVVGGTAQEYGVDFNVIGADVSWSGLALDGVLTAGDKLRVHYYT